MVNAGPNTGGSQFFMFLAKNSTELRYLINELRTKFPDELKIVDVFITLDEIKGYQLQDGVFQQPNEEIKN